MKNAISNLKAAKFLLSVNPDLLKNNHSETEDVNGQNIIAEFATWDEFGEAKEWDSFSSISGDSVNYNRYEKGGYSIIVYSGNFDGSDHGYILNRIPSSKEIKKFISNEILNAELV